MVQTKGGIIFTCNDKTCNQIMKNDSIQSYENKVKNIEKNLLPDIKIATTPR